MHIDITPEALLTQLDYPINEHTLEQINKAIDNTLSFDDFSKHLLSLKDNIAHYYGFIALSNSHNYFKIKCEESESEENIKAFRDATEAWAHKYKVIIQQVDSKPTFYIIGQQ